MFESILFSALKRLQMIFIISRELKLEQSEIICRQTPTETICSEGLPYTRNLLENLRELKVHTVVITCHRTLHFIGVQGWLCDKWLRKYSMSQAGKNLALLKVKFQDNKTTQLHLLFFRTHVENSFTQYWIARNHHPVSSNTSSRSQFFSLAWFVGIC